MKKALFSILAGSLLFASCADDKPVTRQEEKTIDSLVNNEDEMGDSMFNAIQSKIDSLNDAEGEGK